MTTKRETHHTKGDEMDAQLENVLDSYAASEPGPSRGTLAGWIREYPQFARELTEFTAKWQLLEWADETPSLDTVANSEVVPDDDRRLLRGMSAAQSAFYALRANRQVTHLRQTDTTGTTSRFSIAAENAPLSSLFAAAKRVGFTHAQLKNCVGLSDALLQKLNRRLIDPRTIPVRIISDLAGALQQSVADVAAYLAFAPTFAVGAQHRANQAPTLPKTREDFFDAVRDDAALFDSRRQELLALTRHDVSDTSSEA